MKLKMAAMEVDDIEVEQPSSSTAGKGGDKKRFEVKKVTGNFLSRVKHSSAEYLVVFDDFYTAF